MLEHLVQWVIHITEKKSIIENPFVIEHCILLLIFGRLESKKRVHVIEDDNLEVYRLTYNF